MSDRGLTTHVLDLAHGTPAVGVAVAVERSEGGAFEVVALARTNADGRTDEPLLDAAAFRAGTYEVTFEVGNFFADHPVDGEGDADAAPPFFDDVTVKIQVRDDTGPVHLALLVTPWSYSTYRGR